MNRTRYSRGRIPHRFGMNKKFDAFTIIAIVIVVIASVVVYLWNNRSDLASPSLSDGECELHMIDVGQGDACLITTDEGNILIDAGPQEGEDELERYLLLCGIESLDYVILTHPHEDHIGNADMVIDNFYVKNVIMPDVTTTTVCFEALLESIDDSGSRLIMAEQGDTYKVGGLSFKILGPAECDPENLNNCSIVLRADYGDVSMLFSGDAERSAELEVYERYADELDCDIFKVGHHGSSTSNCDEFITAASPDLALISCELGNSYGHPHREVIAMLKERGITYRRTDIDGDVVVATDGEKYWIKEE